MNKKLKILAWSSYDLANTAFSALFVTFFFPLYIKVYLGGNELHIGLVAGTAMLLAGLLVPILGAISDVSGRRMQFVIFFTLMCVIATSLVAVSGLYMALILGLIAIFAYHMAVDVYDATLLYVSNKRNIGLVSGLGIALGYLGTVLSLGIAYVLLNIYGWDTKIGVQSIFPATAIFFLAFSIITFIFIKDKVLSKINISEAYRKAMSEIKITLSNLPKQKDLLHFLTASFLYTGGMNTAILFLYLYGAEQVKLTMIHFFYVYGGMAVAAVIGSILFGKLADKYGTKKSIMLAVIIWILVIITLLLVSTTKSFIIAGSLGGLALGAIWTITRPMLTELVSRKKSTELFGFQGFTEKTSGVFGPVIFGFLVVKFNYQVALFSVLCFFVLSLIFLSKVRYSKV